MRSGRRYLGLLGSCAVAMATTGGAAADPPASGRVELLHRVDSTVAVSSTVANASTPRWPGRRC